MSEAFDASEGFLAKTCSDINTQLNHFFDSQCWPCSQFLYPFKPSEPHFVFLLVVDTPPAAIWCHRAAYLIDSTMSSCKAHLNPKKRSKWPSRWWQGLLRAHDLSLKCPSIWQEWLCIWCRCTPLWSWWRQAGLQHRILVHHLCLRDQPASFLT